MARGMALLLDDGAGLVATLLPRGTSESLFAAVSPEVALPTGTTDPNGGGELAVQLVLLHGHF